MDEFRLLDLDRQTYVVVPTAGLASHLQETFANHQLAQGKEVWEAPNIFSWTECLNLLWQSNQTRTPNRTLLSAQQSQLLWSQVIEQSRYQQVELTLLNVPQTVNACMRSDRLVHDWGIDRKKLQNTHISDLSQFLEWQRAYEQLLLRANAVDLARLQQSILELAQSQQLQLNVKKIVWYGYDLLTDAQHELSALLADLGVEVLYLSPHVAGERKFAVFQDVEAELRHALQQAKHALNTNAQQSIQLIVPDLQHRYAQVQELARQVFYPNSSLLDTQRNNLVYRFSLGKPLHEWPAIESALTLLTLLKGSIALDDLAFLLRSRFLHALSNKFDTHHSLIAWIRKIRIRRVQVERVPQLIMDYCQQNDVAVETMQPLIDLFGQSHETIMSCARNKQETVEHGNIGAATDPQPTRQSYSYWSSLFGELLAIWGWHTYPVGGEFNTVEHQLQQRWDSVLEEFAKFSVVQRTVGLSQAVVRLQQLARESVFLPKSVNSPLVISGLLEALGKKSDFCFLTGMTQSYPSAARSDPFIPNQVLANTGYPDASAQRSVKQAQKVMRSLFAASQFTQVSYALRTDSRQDAENQASPLFTEEFKVADLVPEVGCETSGLTLNQTTSQTANRTASSANQVHFETYFDSHGRAWDAAKRVKGGVSVFKDQSQCPFKAYATHRLGFTVEPDVEFGLDHLDRGVLMHKMLELVWHEIPDQSTLLQMSSEEQDQLLQRCFEQLLSFCADLMPPDKLSLFAMEQRRITELTAQWLELERQRPEHFSVVEREQAYRGEWAGIAFEFTIDRVDLLDDGKSLIIDYKTGSVDRKSVMGDRLREPQLPLYVLTRDAQKASQAAGLAFAEIKRGSLKFVELAEAGVFRKASTRTAQYEEDWHEGRKNWPTVFPQLAQEFLAGHAAVDPIDQQVCQYCDLASVCRVQELRDNTRSAASEETGV